MINSNQLKAYGILIKEIDFSNDDLDKFYHYMKLYIKLDSDIKKVTGMSMKSTKFYVEGGKKSLTTYKSVVKEVKHIRDELSMLHERINTEVIREKVFKVSDLQKQKSYVDSLYRGKESQNKVR